MKTLAALGRFIRSLYSNTAALREHTGTVQSLHPHDVAILEDAQALIGQILRQVRDEPPEPAKEGKRKKTRRECAEAGR